MRTLRTFAAFLLVTLMCTLAFADSAAGADAAAGVATWTPLVVVGLSLIAYSIRNFTPNTGWLHTGGGHFAIALVTGALGAVADAIQTHGLTKQAILWGLASAIGGAIGAANPSVQNGGVAPAPDARTKQTIVGVLLPLLLLPTLLGSGCASAQKDTMLAELGLSSSLSLGYKTIDGIDQVRVDAIHAELQTGQVAQAKADYAAYKPKIEKARASLNTAEDTLENAEKVRAAIPTGGDVTQYTAWLPALAAAAATVTQVIADVKGLVQ